MDDILGMPGVDRLKICKVYNQHPVTIESYWNQGVIELLVELNKKNLSGDVTAYQLTRSVTVGYYEIKLHQCVKWKFKLLFTRKTFACFGTLANYRLYMWPMNFPLPSIGVKSHYSNDKISPWRGIEPRSPAWQAGILTTILSRNVLSLAIKANPIIGVIEPCQKVKETAAAYVKFYQWQGVYSLVQVNWQKLDRVILDNVLHLIDEE